MNDADKIALLKASILNIGRLLPPGMSVTFRHDSGAAATMEIMFPDGHIETLIFTGHSPIYNVPAVPSEYGVCS
ncbi:MAG: hypothetical protein FWF20_07010 [Betaproteobacteria bacterium]|nr:hypothetical protein [Betaproteobacteria bacterium]MCL2886518.1 hypothetical protein [Betaproteobacteria bacterium]